VKLCAGGFIVKYPCAILQKLFPDKEWHPDE
jgi:hypothetical protein